MTAVALLRAPEGWLLRSMEQAAIYYRENRSYVRAVMANWGVDQETLARIDAAITAKGE